LLVEALDPEWIGTLSPAILTGLLRGELGHQGLVVTDALEMAGVADILPEPEAAIEAVRAGADVLLTGRDPAENQQVFEALLAAVRSGRVPGERFEQAVRNVLEAKARFAESSYVPDPARASEVVGAAGHRAQAREMARRTITVVRDAGHVPLPRDLGARLVVLSPLGSRSTMMEKWTFGQSDLGREVLARAPGAVEVAIEYPVDVAARRDVEPVVAAAEVVVVGTLNAIVDPDQVSFLEWLRGAAPSARLVVVGMRTPYEPLVLPWLETYVCAYSSVEPSMIATAEVLFGERPALGQLPVRVGSEQRERDA
jgi:beta-N-acetylhexosaminidase